MEQHKKLKSTRISKTALPTSIQKTTVIEIVENKRILIEQHKGVAAFACEEVCVKVQKGFVHVTGKRLEILCMTKEKIVICGVIESVRLR